MSQIVFPNVFADRNQDEIAVEIRSLTAIPIKYRVSRRARNVTEPVYDESKRIISALEK